MRLHFFAKGLSGASSKHFRKCLVKIIRKLSNSSRGSVILGCFSGILFFIQEDTGFCSAVCSGSLEGMGCKCLGTISWPNSSVFMSGLTPESEVLRVALWRGSPSRCSLQNGKVDLDPDQSSVLQTNFKAKNSLFLKRWKTQIFEAHSQIPILN